MINYKRYLGLLVVLALSIWTIKPLFASGFFPMHDDTQVARVFEMGKALRDGMLPVRWVADLGYGYGYPIFNFYAPLAYYIGGIVTLFSIDALIATKIMMGLGMLLAGIFMYLLAKALFGEIAGVVGAIFYVYAPYHAVNLYIRGAIAELYAYAFIPLAFYGIWMVVKEQKYRYVIFGSIGYGGVILSHNLSAMIVTPFLLFFALYTFLVLSKRTTASFLYSVMSLILGLFISAFYWLPALLEISYTNVFSQIGGGADFRNHFVCIHQLWNSEWGFGGSSPGCIDGMSFRLGKLHLFVVFVSIFLFLISFLNIGSFRFTQLLNRSTKAVVGFLLIGFFLSIAFMLEVLKPLWEAIPPMAFIQYPWRFLLLGSFFSSMLSAFVVWFLHKLLSKQFLLSALFYVFVGSMILLILYFNIKLFQPRTIFENNVSHYTNELAIKLVASKISDEYMPKNFVKPKSIEELPKKKIYSNENNINILQYRENTQKINATIESDRNTNINVAIAYFLAWKIYLDGKRVMYEVTPVGLIFNAPIGVHEIVINFEQTIIEKIANIITLSGIVMLVAGIIASRERKYYEF